MVIALGARDKSNKSGTGHRPVSIVIPRQAEYIGLCRLLVGAVGSCGSMHAEDVADLKLAVTEACACFLSGNEDCIAEEPEDRTDDPSEALHVDFLMQPGAWEVIVSDPARRYHIHRDTHAVSSGSGGLGLTIMEALADEVEHTYTESEGSVIRMAKRVAIPVDDQE